MSNKTYLLASLMILWLWTGVVHSQPPDTLWTETYGGTLNDHGRVVEQTDDGGFVVMGRSNSYGTSAFTRFWLVKTDNLGIVEWQSVYGPFLQTTYLYDGQQTSDGGFALTGYIDVSIYPQPDDADFYLVKTDPLGSVEWELIYGYTGFIEICYSVAQTMDDGYIMVGITNSTGTNDVEIFLVKVDADGVVEWDAKYDFATSEDRGRSVIQTSGGDYVVSAHSQYSSYDGIMVLKVDDSGVMIWNVFILGKWCDSPSIQQTNDGGYILVGETCSPGRDIWLIKLTSTGTEEWQGTYGEPGNDYGESVIQTSDGGYLATGMSYSEDATSDDHSVYVVKTDSVGEMEWEALYGGEHTEGGYCITTTVEGGFAVVGSTNSFGAGYYDAWLIIFQDLVGISDYETISPGLTSEIMPNPFKSMCSITYHLPTSALVTVVMYDSYGRQINTLIHEIQSIGEHSVTWDGKNENNEPAPDGIYFILIRAGDQQVVERVVLLGSQA